MKKKEDDMLTPRVERLKKQIVNARPEVYAERALLVTQAYQETENERPEIQKARAMEKIFRQSTVLIKDDELIVGERGPAPKVAQPKAPKPKLPVPSVVSKALASLAGAGIKTTTYWVIGHPGETESDFQSLLEFA